MCRTGNQLNVAPAKIARVVVVGGGFGGLSVVKALRRGGMQVVLIDSNNFHQFQPLLYQVATSGLEPTAISFPLRRVLRGRNNYHFRMVTVTKVDTQRNTIETTVGELSYDYLILAHGATTNYFSIANIERDSLPLKSVGEALRLRNQIYRTMEQAVDIADAKQRQAYLNFVIVGGGATGVELAGAVSELRNKILPRDYPEIDFTKMRVILMNATERILENFSLESSERALYDLQKMGVEVMLNTRVSDYVDHQVCYNDSQQIAARNLVWASGIKACKMEGISSIGVGGRIVVDLYNKVEGCANVYAIGDVAVMGTKPHPQVAQVAIQQGRNLGQNLRRIVRNEPLKPFVYRDKGSMATIGRNRAVVEIGNLRISGFIAWIMWLFVHLLFILGVRNRFTIVCDWAWSYITHDQPLRSIIEAKNRNNETK